MTSIVIMTNCVKRWLNMKIYTTWWRLDSFEIKAQENPSKWCRKCGVSPPCNDPAKLRKKGVRGGEREKTTILEVNSSNHKQVCAQSRWTVLLFPQIIVPRAAQNFWGPMLQTPNWKLAQNMKVCQVSSQSEVVLPRPQCPEDVWPTYKDGL